MTGVFPDRTRFVNEYIIMISAVTYRVARTRDYMVIILIYVHLTHGKSRPRLQTATQHSSPGYGASSANVAIY